MAREPSLTPWLVRRQSLPPLRTTAFGSFTNKTAAETPRRPVGYISQSPTVGFGDHGPRAVSYPMARPKAVVATSKSDRLRLFHKQNGRRDAPAARRVHFTIADRRLRRSWA